MQRSHYRLLCAVVLLFLSPLLFMPYSVIRAMTPFDFGGNIQQLSQYGYCLDGLGGTIAPPIGDGSTVYFWVYGLSAQKMYGPPYMQNQLVLGQSIGYIPCLYYCGTSVCTDSSYSGYIVMPNAGSALL